MDTAAYLQSIVDQTVQLMNEGKSLNEILYSVKISDEFSEKSYLKPFYDEPQFIVRNIWRLYGGWYCFSFDRSKSEK